MMRKSIVFVLLTISCALSQGLPAHAERVWFWFGDCPGVSDDGRTMEVEIRVEGETVYRSTFRACEMERSDSAAQNAGRARVFYFSGGHTFQNIYRTTKKARIEGNIWQAGADPDDILLGVSFVAHGQILLNTIHIVKPGVASSSMPDRGVVIKTYPMTEVPSSAKHGKSDNS